MGSIYISFPERPHTNKQINRSLDLVRNIEQSKYLSGHEKCPYILYPKHNEVLGTGWVKVGFRISMM